MAGSEGFLLERERGSLYCVGIKIKDAEFQLPVYEHLTRIASGDLLGME